ncbi:MAG TPA: hypothetical protein VLF63_01760 [Patescibacteria group bacterium]|nr:hypothetical protein [Patescibacteria group bacterium]
MRRQTLIKFVFCLIIFAPVTVFAAQSSSPNYQVNEVFIGNGGALNVCSSNYCAKESLGEIVVGKTSSTNFQAQAGFNTDRTPFLEFIVNQSTVDLGGLSTGSTTTTTATFSVKNYLSSGYQVVTVSNPPKNNSYTIHNLTTPTASSAGTEQFGINLVANTSPTTFGANPNQVPSNVFSFGSASSGYNTANQYKYVPGDIIAHSTSSSGETDYTISYIYNISNITPGGVYTFNDTLVATATY